ncbi:MAG TPA: DUF2243 domain-containing protein [Blastocatellia bacterium]|jgi:uncharacterized membrane protein|nr:DUF2243 domain-containing protein [Blastocatellia bacterium]
MAETRYSSKPVTAGILLGVGLGGFVDGITLHQIAQWHNMLSAKFPPHDSMDNMKFNMLWDGLFHAATWIVTVIGLFMLWGAARDGDRLPSTRSFVGSLILGWGLFNLVEGIIDHQLLGIHHVREVPNALAYDMTFLAVGGVLFILIGWTMLRGGRRTV